MKRVLPAASLSEENAKKQASYRDPSFSRDVIAWQAQFGRHSLPWQQSRDAYRVWLSEIMLQQTQVAAVIPYYQRFLQKFPQLIDLASASSEEVMALWSGLGYYTRARNLHQCAKQIVLQYKGVFPSDPELLQALPGIGRSTAAAIAAFSYGTRAAILDGNVKRVFARVFGVEGYPGSKVIEDDLWLRASALIPEQGIEAYTQGLMDLGATLCTRSRPNCLQCPLRQRCNAFQTERTTLLPTPKPKMKINQKYALMLLMTHAGEVLLEQRPAHGIWGGLLSLPEVNGMREEPYLPDGNWHDAPEINLQAQNWGEIAQLRTLPPTKHSFTHFTLHIQALHIDLSTRHPTIGQSTSTWLPLSQVADAALPAPIKSLLLGFSASGEESP